MIATHFRRSVLAAGILAALAIATGGCAAPPSYSALDDDAIKKLFPTETEIKTAVGDINRIIGPKADVPEANATPPESDGMSEGCPDAVYGGLTSMDAFVPTRTFFMRSAYTPIFGWVLSQGSSADEIQKMQDAYEERLAVCDQYEFFDSGTSSGTGVAIKPSQDGKGSEEGASVIVTSGDVSMAFDVVGMPYEKAKDVVKKMAPVMEKRLKASAPKN